MKNQNNNKFILLLGILLVSYIIYNRVFRIRIPKEFNEIFFIRALLLTGIMFSLLILFLWLYYKYMKNLDDVSKVSFFDKLFKVSSLEKIHNHKYNIIRIIHDSMIGLDTFIKDKIPFYNHHERYFEVLLKHTSLFLLSRKYRIIAVILLFLIIPQSIVSLSFIFDILFNNKFLYFYKNLWLLIFPLLLNYYIYSLKQYVEMHFELFDFLLILKIIPKERLMVANDDEYIIVTAKEWFELLSMPEGKDYVCDNNLSPHVLADFGDDLLSAKNTLNATVDYMSSLFYVARYRENYIEYRLIFKLPLSIIKYLIFFIGWFYILIMVAPDIFWIKCLANLLHTLYVIEDPFSGILLFTEFLNYTADHKDLFKITMEHIFKHLSSS